MGIQARKERKEKEKLEMRERIIEAAGRLFVELGFEHTSIRKIADAIDYSVGALYLYFPGGKDELFYTIHERGFVEFGRQMRETESIPDPLDQLKALGAVYLRFSFENPEYYNLMFIENAPMQTPETDENWEAGMRTYSCLEETVAACIAAGYFSDPDVKGTTFFIWSTMHGMVSLALRKRLKMYDETLLPHMMEKVTALICTLLEKK